MNAPTKLDPIEFNLMRNYIEKHCGIRLTDEKTYLVETRLTTLMVERGFSTFTELYRYAVEDATHVLRDKIVDAMTTHETLWFRDQTPFVILEKIFLPQMAERMRSGGNPLIHIWSAACATGQEAYSIAMTVLEYCAAHGGISPGQVKITATDISPAALFLAAAGRFDAMAISRGLPDAMREKYFRQDGKVWIIDEKVKRMVEFKKHNLQDSFAPLGRQDIVFCRNVCIYFSDEFKRDMFRRIAGILRPAGYLIIGGSESLINYSTEYSMLTSGRAMYYQVRAPVAAGAVS